MRFSVKIVLVGLLSIVTAMSRAQDVTPTVDVVSDTPTATATLPSTPIPTSTDTTAPEPTLTESQTATSVSSLPTESPSLALSPTLEPSPVEVTPEATAELPTAFLTLTPTDTDQLLTATVEITAISPTLTLTASVSPSMTLISYATETAEMLMMLVSGNALYQNHGNDQTGIKITVFDADEHLIGVTETDANGQYAINIPAHSSYQVIIEASLHRRVQFLLIGDEQIPDVVLAGGDLDADGCISQLDLALFMSLFNSVNISQGDITGDGMVGAADFAVLTGNYENSCSLIEPTPLATSFPVSPAPSLTFIASVTPEAPITTPTEEPTVIEATLSPLPASTLDIDSTLTPSPESGA